MKVSIIDIKGNEFDAFIEQASKKDIKSLGSKWQFDWSKIYEDDQLTFKLVKDKEIQGLLKLEWENEEYVIMKNVEVSPANFGSQGKFSNVAELLIAFACYQTFAINKNGYIGYLAFTSKGNLIDHYQEKYGAELIFRERMIIAPLQGLKLIETHLKLNIRK
ncbi:hypothetical protein [Portibacter marinus]|uniref:hypothetical protein n=1 Tax=Portibacter marinus TaxID=2898660 RepID=UPI001F32F14F|nr:hypothetical protein [Portibacter marinus]